MTRGRFVYFNRKTQRWKTAKPDEVPREIKELFKYAKNIIELPRSPTPRGRISKEESLYYPLFICKTRREFEKIAQKFKGRLQTLLIYRCPALGWKFYAYAEDFARALECENKPLNS